MFNKIVKIVMVIGILLSISIPIQLKIKAAPAVDFSNMIESFEYLNITNNSVEFKVTMSENLKNNGKLYYLIVEKGTLISSYLDEAALYKDVYDLEDLLMDPNNQNFSTLPKPFWSGYVNFNVGGGELNPIEVQGLDREKNYEIKLVAQIEDEASPRPSTQTSDVPNEEQVFLIEQVNGGDKSTSDRQFTVTAIDDSTNTNLSSYEGNMYSENGSNILCIDNQTTDNNCNSDINDNGTPGDPSDDTPYPIIEIDFSNVIDSVQGDRWVVHINDSGTITERDITTRRYAQELTISDINEMVVEGSLLAFSTDKFEGVNKDNGQGLDGIYIESAPQPIPNNWSFIRGVQANQKGDLEIYFNSSISVVNKDAIQLIESQTNDVYSQTIDASGSVLTINYKELQSKNQYVVTIPAYSLALVEGSNGLGQFNSDEIVFIFYTEKQPDLITSYFSPDSEFFDLNSSPFKMDGEEIYRIPELIGVNKIGVGVNQALILQFDDEIQLKSENRITVDTTPYNYKVKVNNVNLNPDNKTELIITFTNDTPDRLLDFNTIYEVKIPAGVLEDRYGGGNLAENNPITVKFKTSDGFSNAFVKKTAQELNSGILKTPSHNIAIDIPKIYIKELETIHYRDGLIADERTAPNLTNIDIDADDDVATIDIITDRGVRPNLQRSGNEKFSATFAGLNADVTDIKVTAYDDYGKVLERRSFRLQGSPGSEFKNDYVPQITDSFGKTISLYELMKDPQIMENVLEQIPVSELDRIGVFYPYFQPYDLLMR